MKRRGIQLSRRHRLTLYCVSLLLFITGAAWAWADHLHEAREAGGRWDAFRPTLLKVHGFGAVAFVLLVGTLLPGHVRRAWLARKNRGNGAFFLTVIALLTLSGYALYYLGDETWRKATNLFHLWLGLVAPALLFWHSRAGRNATSRR